MTSGSDPRLDVQRLPIRLRRDASRTIARFFWPGSEERAGRVVERVLGLDEGAAAERLEQCMRIFADRHVDLAEIFKAHYRRLQERVSIDTVPSEVHRLLIGAYFTLEYAYAAAALFNPSIVPAASQRRAPPGGLRFLMSMRAVGEGHISSITFRRGTIHGDGRLEFDAVPARSRRMRIVDRRFRKMIFFQKIIEAGRYRNAVDAIIARLDERFTIGDLTAAVDVARSTVDDPLQLDVAAEEITRLAASNYRIELPDGADLQDIVILPISENEVNGLEDMRLVRFIDDDGSARYYGTYTAYDGRAIVPQIMESHALSIAEVHTLHGQYARDKGMALFPRRIGGWYAMIGRIDGEHLYFMTSDNVHFWNHAERIVTPIEPWEFVQMGNCGSPIETEAGWLLLTHGVGAMRRYCIGAVLLDRDDPTRVRGRLRGPLLSPRPDESEGYVPNVVYSCGGLAHAGTLYIPYGISDVEIGFATVPLGQLLDVMTSEKQG